MILRKIFAGFRVLGGLAGTVGTAFAMCDSPEIVQAFSPVAYGGFWCLSFCSWNTIYMNHVLYDMDKEFEAEREEWDRKREKRERSWDEAIGRIHGRCEDKER